MKFGPLPTSTRHRTRTAKSTRFDVGATHRLMGWMVRHCAWVLNRFQLWSDGQTAYRNVRDKNYEKELVQLGEMCYTEETELDLRWNRGVFAGKSEKTHSVDSVRSTDETSGETTFWQRFLGQRVPDNLRWGSVESQ